MFGKTEAIIGIIGAMEEEIELIYHSMSHARQTERAGIEFYEGTWLNRHVVLCRSGVGKVNAAVCTQLLIERYGVSTILFTGVAGALDPKLDVGDIVISQDCMQHDIDASALGFAPGVIPFAKESIFAADPTLIELAVQCGQKQLAGHVTVGRILSGDQFIADRDKVQQLQRQMEGTCTEMEGAAVAQVCVMNAVPFVIIRSISDKADGSAQIDFQEFTKIAANRSYLMIKDMLTDWDSH